MLKKADPLEHSDCQWGEEMKKTDGVELWWKVGGQPTKQNRKSVRDTGNVLFSSSVPERHVKTKTWRWRAEADSEKSRTS